MFKVLGVDGKEYGPVNGEQVRQWVVEGRANGQTLIQPEGSTEWKPLSDFPEFAQVLASLASMPPVSPAIPPAAPMSTAPLAEGDYDLDITGCIGNGWNLLFKQSFSVLFLGALAYFGIELGIGLLSCIPFIGWGFTLGNLVIVGPLMGGLWFLFIQAMRHRPAEVGDLFAGFRENRFLQLLLGQVVSGLLSGLCLIPGLVVLMGPIILYLTQHQEPNIPLLVVGGLVVLLGLVPFIYLTVSWIFTLPLIVDRGMDFWPAMSASRQRVSRHWWQVFGLLVLIWLLNLAGALLCGIGLLFSTPVGFAALMYAYEAIFSGERPRVE